MKVSDLIPEVYYRESRDFAYIGRLVEVIFNYMKTSADSVGIAFSDNAFDDTTIELLVETLGFDIRHNYSNRDLFYIASAFNAIIKNKGTIRAAELLIRLLLNSQNISNLSGLNFCEFDSETFELNILIPAQLSDIVLVEDLFDYILPAGVVYRFTVFENLDPNKFINIAMSDDDSTHAYVPDSDLGIIKDEDMIEGNFYTGVVVTEIVPDITEGDN